MQRENELLQQASATTNAEVDAIIADDCAVGTVGPSLYLDLLIEGGQVSALVDTGSQSTIIARSVLHDIGRHLNQQGNHLPELSRPSVKLLN